MIPKLFVLAALMLVALPVAADAHTLTYGKAKRAAQTKADAFAHADTKIKGLLRLSRHRYEAHAAWTRTIRGGCKECGDNPATGEVFDTDLVEDCFATIAVALRGRRVRTRITSSECE